jgi:ribonuclease HI
LGKIKVFSDGASRGNPGHSGIGVVIFDENGFILKTYKEYIGETTNNQAEYIAIIKSIEQIKKLQNEMLLANGEEIDSIEFYSDSELIVNQINFEYRVKEPELALLNNKFHVLARKLNKPYPVFYIERSRNKNADKLANMAIDSRLKKQKK